MENCETLMVDVKDPKPSFLLESLNSTPIDAELDAIEQEVAAEEELFDEDFLLKIKPDSRRHERMIAFCIVYAADRFDYTVDLDVFIQNLRDGYSLEVAHNVFIMTLVRGVFTDHQLLDERIKPFLKNWKLERLGCCTRIILRMALWELQQADAVPSIVLNEAIELAKLFAEKDAYKFVNGILDEAVKQALVPGPENKETVS